MKAALVLEDGAVFEGEAFGKRGRAFGETVFYTGVVGYQEVVTDPSYHGTLAVLTYPIIGSYGANAEDNQSPRAQAAGIVIRDYSPHYSNFRATEPFEELLIREGVVGIRGVDTRAVATHLRDNGEMKGAIVSGEFEPGEVAAATKKSASPFSRDLAEDWALRLLAGPGGRRLALLDAGATADVMGQFADLGFRTAEDVSDIKAVLAARPAGLVVVGGPGDPHLAKRAANALEQALGRTPVLGIGLGHQIVALALGCGISRMKVGHHGVNHSVRDTRSGKCEATAQHHSFVVGGVASGVEVTHVNVNDGTVEGIRSGKHKAGGVQFRPGRDDQGAPSGILAEFVEGRHA